VESRVKTETQIAVIGAGPAGLAAADLLAAAGCEVTVLDEQPAAGGQIYRGIASASAERLRVLGADYAAGRKLLGVLDRPGVTFIGGATVWEVTRERRISYSVGGAARSLAAGRVILCTGAIERPMPFPGWTLPGVMTVGAGQILLKTAGLLPPSPLVLAGSGPLLYLLAAQYLAARQAISAIVETTPGGNWRSVLRHLPGALIGNRYLRKGLTLLAQIRRAGVVHYRGATGLRAEGANQVEALTITVRGRTRRLPCAALLIHAGVIPNLQITRSLNLAHDWDALQQCWRPRLDGWCGTGIDGIHVAGDGGGIAGAEAAIHSGRLAAIGCLAAFKLIGPEDRDRRTAAERRALRAQNRARPFLDALYTPAPEFLDPPDETIVCRCEEVTAGRIREFVDLGCLGPNQAKSFGRPGMGPCQGRYCGITVSAIIAAHRRVSIDEVGYYRIRPPLKPITLGELAAMDVLDEGDGDDAEA
jgi:NADPH-dependent 2,4-dienoyl-CoA reductase/sulfur reductase-like enzyme